MKTKFTPSIFELSSEIPFEPDVKNFLLGMLIKMFLLDKI